MLAKWLSVRLRTKWFWVRVKLQSLHLQISRLLRARSSVTLRQLQSVDSLWNAYVTWQEHTSTFDLIELKREKINVKESSQLSWPTEKTFVIKLKLPRKSLEILKLPSIVQNIFAFEKKTVVTPDKISGFNTLPGSHFVLAPTPPSPSCDSENQWI